MDEYEHGDDDANVDDDERLYQMPNPVLLPDKEKNLGGLYIGCVYTVGRLSDRKRYGHIGAIVSIGVSLNRDLNGPIMKPGVHPFSAAGYPALLPGVTYRFVDIDDHPRCNIKVHFDPCIKFINEHMRQGTSVFVHCVAGVSRSASIVIAYMMRELHLCYDDAFSQLHACRPIIDPNQGFRKQLKEYEEELHMKRLMERYLNAKKAESQSHGESIV
jgi:hypothetical protein